MANSGSKIWFLQLARILACSLVVYTHWFGLISSPNVIHEMILQDSLLNYPTVILTDYITLVTSFFGLHYFSGVYFGLGLFFILSGYVIPLSTQQTTPMSYLIRRLFRIYPTLIICTILSASVMTLASHYTGSSSDINLFKPSIFITNLLLIRDLFHCHYIDNSTWTLEIEMHFYLLFFAFFYFKSEKKARTYLLTATSLLIISYLLYQFGYAHSSAENYFVKRANLLAKFMSTNGSYLSFMFVGTVLFYTSTKQWSYQKGLISTSLLLAVNYFFLKTAPEPIRTYHDLIFVNHLYVLAFFIFLYLVNNKLPYSKVLNKLAEISYPLYLIHGFTGYALYFLLYHHTQAVLFSACTSLGIVFALALLVHHTIEKPAITMSKAWIQSRRAPLFHVESKA